MTVAELRRAARLLRIVAEAEYADAVGDSREVGRLLAAVDPVEARTLAQRADFDAGVRDIYIRTKPRSAPQRSVW